LNQPLLFKAKQVQSPDAPVGGGLRQISCQPGIGPYGSWRAKGSGGLKDYKDGDGASEMTQSPAIGADGTVRNFVWDRIDQALTKRSSNRMANCALAAVHSLAGIFHSLAARFKTSNSSFSTAS